VVAHGIYSCLSLLGVCCLSVYLDSPFLTLSNVLRKETENQSLTFWCLSFIWHIFNIAGLFFSILTKNYFRSLISTFSFPLQVYAQSPGARIFLACSHAESPPEGVASEIWEKHVLELVVEVQSKVPDPVYQKRKPVQPCTDQCLQIVNDCRIISPNIHILHNSS
jgi:hypothetical protein